MKKCTTKHAELHIRKTHKRVYRSPQEKNTDDSCDGLTAEVIEKTFAGGQLRVVLKTSEGQEIVASRYGIDTNVSVGEKVRCCFSSYRCSAGRSGRKIRRSIAGSVRSLCRRYPCVSTEQAPYG